MGKIGEGTFSAWLREGLHELRAVIYPDSNIAQRTEYGMYGTMTPGEIAEDRRGKPRDLEDEVPQRNESILEQRMQPVADRGDRDDRGMDMER